MRKMATIITIMLMTFVLLAACTDPIEKAEAKPEANPVKTPQTLLKADEMAYIQDILYYTELINEQYFTFGELLQNPDYYSDTWVNETALSLTTMKIGAEYLMQMDVPEKYSRIHGEFIVTGVNKILIAVDKIPKAIDESDSQGIVKGTDYLFEYTSALMRFTEQITEGGKQ